ncbi:hypothetical protein D3C72_1970910 [compost metagenome]
MKQVGEFKNLAPAIKAELPSYFVDKASLEIDFIPADPDPVLFIGDEKSEELLTETNTETETL